MVNSPGEYRWSSFSANGLGSPDRVVNPHDIYQALGSTSDIRRYAYRELFRNALEADDVHAIRTAVQTGTPLGNDRFRAQVEAALGKRVGQARRGRPRRE